MGEIKKILLDTNIVLYLLGGKIDIGVLPEGDIFISFISEMELLSYPEMNMDEGKKINDLISRINIVEMYPSIKRTAIELKKKYKIKLPDAIICATAIHLDAIFFTNDVRLEKISELNIVVIPLPKSN